MEHQNNEHLNTHLPEDTQENSPQIQSPKVQVDNSKNLKLPKIPSLKQLKSPREILLSSRPMKKLKYCVFAGNYPQYIRDALSLRGNWQEIDPQIESIMTADLIWKPFNFTKNVIFLYLKNGDQGFDLFDKRREDVKRPIVYNHYECISVLSTKTGLLKSLRDYYLTNKQAVEANYKVQDTLPMAYIITSNPLDFEYQEFKKKFQNIEKGYAYNEKFAPKQFEQNIWLLKPANMNQGKGIEIFTSLKQVQQFLINKPQDQLWIVQKYIEKPLLYKQRKFDIRVLALGTNDYELYFYNIGYMRTSSDMYSLDNKNKFIHLTNNCYQKHSNNYQKFEQGNQLTFSQFQEYIKETFPDLEIPWEQIMLRMKDLVIDSFLAGVNNFNPNKREHVFEVMGFDFMIDEDFRVWLIEVNTNPYFGVLNDKLPKFIDNLVDDTMRLTVDKVFNREIPDSDRPSQYELLYSAKQNVNKRRPFNEGIYPVQSIKENLDQEKLAWQKSLTVRNDQSIVQAQKQQSISNQQPQQDMNLNLKTKQKNQNKNFYMTLEGSTRSKSALSFKQADMNEAKRYMNKENKISKKFKQNVNISEKTKIEEPPVIFSQHENSIQQFRKSLESPMEKLVQNQDSIQKLGSPLMTQKVQDDDYAPNYHPNALTQFNKLHNNPMGQTSLSVLLRKKAEEASRLSQLNQNEYLNKIQRMLKMKDLLEQIKESSQNLGENYEQKKKEFNRIFNQICHIFSNPTSYNKKDINQAIQGMRLLVFSQFIVQFNEKSILNKYLDLLKINYQQILEIRDCLIRNLQELSKHFQIRSVLLNKKLISKFSKILLENLTLVELDSTQIEFNLQLINQLSILSSVSNSKHYIPGETKEIESLRRKGIQNGVIAVADMLYLICPNKQCREKIQSDILDCLDNTDRRTHIYTVYSSFLEKIHQVIPDQNQPIRESKRFISAQEKAQIETRLQELMNNTIFQQISSYIEGNQKKLKPKIPSAIEQMTDYFNMDYLFELIDKYESFAKGHGSRNQSPTKKKNLTSTLSKESLPTNEDLTPNIQQEQIKKNLSEKKSQKSRTDKSLKTKSNTTKTILDREVKSQESHRILKPKENTLTQPYNSQAQKSKADLLNANRTYQEFSNQLSSQDFKTSDAHISLKYEANAPQQQKFQLNQRNNHYNNKSFERIKQQIRDVDILKRPHLKPQSKDRKVKSIRHQFNTNNQILPTLSDNSVNLQYQGGNESLEKGSGSGIVNENFQSNRNSTKDNSSLILPNLTNQLLVNEQQQKKQLLYYGIGTNFYNQGGFNKVLQEASQLVKLQPYLQNNAGPNKNQKKLTNSAVKSDYQNLGTNQSSSLISNNQSSTDFHTQSTNQSMLPLSQNIMKSNYYKSGFISKVKKHQVQHSHQLSNAFTTNNQAANSAQVIKSSNNIQNPQPTNIQVSYYTPFNQKQSVQNQKSLINTTKSNGADSLVLTDHYSNLKNQKQFGSVGQRSVPLSQKSYGIFKNQTQPQSDTQSEIISDRQFNNIPQIINTKEVYHDLNLQNEDNKNINIIDNNL